jgi:hypothetical protein
VIRNGAGSCGRRAVRSSVSCTGTQMQGTGQDGWRVELLELELNSIVTLFEVSSQHVTRPLAEGSVPVIFRSRSFTDRSACYLTKRPIAQAAGRYQTVYSYVC